MGWRLISYSAIITFALSAAVFATSEKDITFPVAELGNCKDKQECKIYCERTENFDSCIVFAKKHNLISESDAKRFEKAKKIPAGGGPGGCQGFEECHQFCSNPDNMPTCIEFAKANGMMSAEEIEEAEKVLKALRERGVRLPGGCTSKESCEAYCSQGEHIQECMEFAHQAGFMSDKEYEMAKKVGGKGPGGCTGRACKDFCENPNNFETCIEFAKEHGMISDKEYEMAKKTGGKGPGGCRGEECQAYCQTHQEECFEWAKEQGLIPEEQLQKMEEFKKGIQSPEEFERRVREHKGEFIPQGEEPKGFEGFNPPTGGPGGCKTPEECKAYCSQPEHFQECGVPPTGGPPAGGQPPSDFPQEFQPQSGFNRLGATLIYTLQFLMGR